MKHYTDVLIEEYILQEFKPMGKPTPATIETPVSVEHKICAVVLHDVYTGSFYQVAF